MKYANISHVDKPVSRIIYGTAIHPFNNSGEGILELLDAMLDRGVTTLDTARVYGDSEESLGKWLHARNNRNEVVLLSKCGHHDTETFRKRVNRKEMFEDLETSLRLLQTDYIDIYILHRDDPDVPVGEIVEIFNDMHKQGKIGAFGGSNWTWQRIQEANDYAAAHGLIPFEVSSPNFSLARQVVDPYGGGCISISGADAEEAQSWYRENQMAVVSYSSLAHGFLSGRLDGKDETSGSRILDEFGLKGFDYPENYERLRRCEELAAQKGVTVPQIAVAWLYHQGINEFAVISTGNPGRMQSNIDALDIEITKEENDYLNLK